MCKIEVFQYRIRYVNVFIGHYMLLSVIWVYSGASEKRTLWGIELCPFLRGRPNLRDFLNISILVIITMNFK